MQMRPENNEEVWEARLERASAYALYLHVPFCARKCAYCDFASWATAPDDALMARYADALTRQVDEAESLGLLEGVQTGYIGGGTPSLLGADSLGRVVRRTSSLGLLELSCEANPDSLSGEVLDALAGEGATRVSVGVQSLDDAELRELGRLHDSAAAIERVGAAVSRGLDVSCDLMCATPRQTDDSWRSSLDKILMLGASHVSVYPLMIEEGTAFERRFEDDSCEWNSDEVQARRMEMAQVQLEGHGFNRYEVASYSFPKKHCRHNVAYWTGQPYLGLGTNASSMLTLKGYLRLSQACPGLPRPPRDAARARLTVTSSRQEIADDARLASLRFSFEFLDAAQAAAEDLMLGARLAAGLHPGLVVHARDLLPGLDDALAGLVSDGFIAAPSTDLAGAGFRPTEKGWLLGNELYGRLWDLAPGEVVSSDS